jgi:hypothetical protein
MVEHRTVAPSAEGSNPFSHPVVAMRPSTRTLVAAIALLAVLTVPCRSLSAKEEDPVLIEPPPILRYLVGALGGGSSMSESIDSGVTWSYAVGFSAELSLADAGLTPAFQAGYLVPNTQWYHAIPLDIAGRYVWNRGRLDAYLSGGMSVFIYDRKIENDDGKVIGDWEVTPLIYLDLGTRIMFMKHLGIEIRLEVRTYIVINVIGLRVGLAF